MGVLAQSHQSSGRELFVITIIQQNKSIFIGIILGTTIWLLIERDVESSEESVAVNFDHQGSQGSFQIFGKTGEFKLEQKVTGDVLTGRIGNHLTIDDFKAAEKCEFGDYCLGTGFRVTSKNVRIFRWKILDFFVSYRKYQKRIREWISVQSRNEK